MTPETDDVVLVAFEGPDRYSFVGGLATRMNDLAEALATRGYRVRQIFVGDPEAPATELRHDGRLLLERWCQWISRHHPRDVYDGETGKWRDFTRTVPRHLVDDVVASAAAGGRRTVVLFEDWQTADAAIATAALLRARGIARAALFWNANNTYGLGGVDLDLLAGAATITTVSRYMRAELARLGVDAAVLPNGIAERFLAAVPPGDVRTLRAAFAPRPTVLKVARFDADKRWLWAIDAVGAMRDAGMWPRLLMRGSRSDYADVVSARIRAHGLRMERVALAPAVRMRDAAAQLSSSDAEVVFLDFFVPEALLRALYAACDGVLANSEREPFGLVGLEVMACGGIAFVGRTGEDYAIPYGNAVVVQSDDPAELRAHLARLAERPALLRSMRAEGRSTARRFAWPRVLEALEASWDAALPR